MILRTIRAATPYLTTPTPTKPSTPITQPFSVHNYMKTFQKQQVTRYHGHFRVDEYNHFDKDETAERHNFTLTSNRWKHYTEQYYQISSSRRDARTNTVPQRIDGYQYYTKIAWKGTREYSTVHRRRDGHQEELVLDLMAYPLISKYYQTAQLLSTSFSPSHDLVAFGVDLKNNEKSSYFIAKTTGKRELISIGQSHRNKMLQNAHDLTFASEHEIYFLRSQNHRPCQLCWMNIKTGQSKELFVEENEQFYLGLRKSKDKAYLLVSGVSKSSSKLWAVDLRKQSKLLKVWQGAGKVYINHVDNYFIVWVSKECSEVKLIQDGSIKNLIAKQTLDLSKIPGEVVYTSAEEEVVEDIDLFTDRIVLYGYNVTTPILKILSYTKQNNKLTVNINTANLPYTYGTIQPCSNQDYNSQDLLFSVSTPFVYQEVYSYNLESRKINTIQKYEHTGPSIPTHKYKVSTVEVPATDGALIPLTIISPKKVTPSKLILHFYGCYGLATRVAYDNVTIAALEKGWTVCHAHVRGGNQKGKKWHQQSQGNNIIRSWLDVQQCVGYLLRENYTHPSLLFLSSSSAGAINLWNVISRKPYLYKGAIFRMPFLDVLSSLLDPTQPLSNTDYQEFGNPISQPDSYRRIASISPYENISTLQYPALHFIAGENDYRTPIAQLAKFVSRLRDRKAQNGRLTQLGVKGVTVDISKSGSHLGEASVKDQNYKGCDVYGYMDYVINNCSKDCSKQ